MCAGFGATAEPRSCPWNLDAWQPTRRHTGNAVVGGGAGVVAAGAMATVAEGGKLRVTSKGANQSFTWGGRQHATGSRTRLSEKRHWGPHHVKETFPLIHLQKDGAQTQKEDSKG